MENYDVIVVGSGSTGGVLAARLSENADRSVLLLEAGKVYERVEQLPPSVLDPADMSNAMPGNPNNWSLPGTMIPGRRVPSPRGKIMGGSGSINGAYFIRGTRSNFDEWAKQGNDAWSYDQVLPCFTRLESDHDFGGDLHGSDGPVSVQREPSDRAPEFTAAFTAACRDLGHPDEPDKNAGGDAGVGPVPMNIGDGRRQSSAVTHLIPALGRPNLHVRGNTHVRRVVLDGSRCVGVEADVDGVATVFRAKETILSAGAFRSPQLLMVSGIGPADHLRELGIPVRQDLPGVGANLTDHPELSVQWTFSGKVPARPGRGLLTSALHWTAQGSDQPGDLEILPFVATSGNMMKIPTMARRPLKALSTIRQTSMKFVLDQTRALRHPFVVIGLQQQDSRGSVRLASADPAQFPVIDWNVMAEESDRRRFREGIRLTNEIFQSSAMRAAGGRLVNLRPADLASDAALDTWARGHLFAAGHPSCTCRMGPDSDPTAVVDQHAKVHGVDGLRVADTSIFPKIPSRGPNATAFMVGGRVADFFD